MTTSIVIGDATVPLGPVENGFNAAMLGGKGTSASINEIPRRGELKTSRVEAHVACGFAGGVNLHVLQHSKSGNVIGEYCAFFDRERGITRFEPYGEPEINRGAVEKEMQKLVEQPEFKILGSAVDFEAFRMAVTTIVRK